MRLRNTSRYPDAEVRRLVDLATKGVNMSGVAVHVKNSRYAYAGRAYQGVPSCSPASRSARVMYLVTVRIGAPGRFPTTNMRTVRRWVDVSDDEARADPANCAFMWSERRGSFARRQIVERHPYGGKRSPLLELADWREALVAVAAHEARHIHQYRHAKRRSEVDCERFAAKRLAVYRGRTGQ